ncbi:hypothetical protein ACP4OV_019977 [Aristida adscensionis]
MAATFTTAAASAALASPTASRPAALAARQPAGRWAPLRCSPPAVGSRRGAPLPRRGGTLKVQAKKQTFSSFDELLEKSEKPVLVDFYATCFIARKGKRTMSCLCFPLYCSPYGLASAILWCGPCQYMVPILQEVSEKLSDKIQIVKIDTEKYTSIASRYRIEALPTFIIFKDGKPCYRFEGALPANQLIEQIESALAVTK